MGIKTTRPQPFTVMPISYDNAFGGVDNFDPDPQKQGAFIENPVGKGFFLREAPDHVEGKPLPNTEEPGDPVNAPGSYRPMAFGPIGRAWQPRPGFAGTYDQNWIDNIFPFLPADFDERYYQSAPSDQQTDYLRGGEEVVLTGLTPHGRCSFNLPQVEVPVTFFLRNYEQKETSAVADTLVLEPDLGRFVLLWRASLPLRKSIFEVVQAVAGRMPRGWYKARELGKTWYPSLGTFVANRRGEGVGVAEEPELEEEVQ
jgi:hypothetical protein